MVCKHRPATISDDVVWDYCVLSVRRRSFSLYLPCISNIKNARLTCSAQAYPVVEMMMRINWATVCLAIRMGTSGKVRGMRAECPGGPFQATNPPQPPPVFYGLLTIVESTKGRSTLQADIRPLKQSQKIKRSATSPSRPRYEYNPTHVP